MNLFRRPLFWLVISVLCFVGAWYTWQWAERRAGGNAPQPETTTPTATAQPEQSRQARQPAEQIVRGAGAADFSAKTGVASSRTNWQAYRLTNSSRTPGELLRDPRAVLLENAVIDTGTSQGFSLPEHLRALPLTDDERGSYIVQARGAVTDAFRAQLRAAGAEIVSYIPNNAYLVRMDAGEAERLRGTAEAVMAWEPYYKLKSSLLKLGVEQQPLPEGALLNMLVFADAQSETTERLTAMGAEVVGEGRSPFGVILTVRPAAATGWTEMAQWNGVQLLELYQPRVSANDLSRERIEVSVDTVVTTNYLNLTGTNVLVNVNDTGVDAAHPELSGRVFGDSPVSITDDNGHGTHVAGIIASSGLNDDGVGAAASGSLTNADFRGKAPAALIFSMVTGLDAGVFQSDAYLQEQAARTNALISNNSWHFGNDNTYNLGAANYDAAVRDALPALTGSQPLLYVFAAGNAGDGNDAGLSGDPESILSPATAKNVITVGSIEQLRDITNEVVIGSVTNKPWEQMTSSDNQVAAYSSRGNVGIGIEGDFGRYKPDVIAPGTFVVSLESTTWNKAAYYNPTNHHVSTFPDQIVRTNSLNNYSLFVPQNAVQVFINLFPNQDSPVPFPDLPIFVRQAGIPTTNTFDFVVTNAVSMPPDNGPGLAPVGVPWFYSIGNTTTQNVSFDIVTDILTTNDNGNYLQVLSNLNNRLGPNYRYESGTSMSAADVSGTLALMQEFFEQRLGVTNSPALYKALLINGARAVSPLYDFQVNNTINFQGWGLVNLPNSIPVAETNVLAGITHSGPASLHIFDQHPTNALASGQSQTQLIQVSEFGRNLPLRVTLVWTDPPGNPAAGVKLVNDLDLIVTNLDTGEIYIGNDIGSGSNFTFPGNTNTPSDVVNNVENVYLIPQLGTNYAVTVVGRHVNVNAVTAHTNDVVQDYALVISCGDGEVLDALTLGAPPPRVSVTAPPVTGITNSFGNSPTITGSLLLGQHVGANTPLLGTTNGLTNQWHFYTVTNTSGYTNAAFVTFLPPELSVPRIGVREDNLNNATRIEADVDLYVSLNPALLSLDPVVVANAEQSRGRLGTELIVYSNALPDQVYYIGVKAEDQVAAEYALLAVFSLNPFSQRDPNGNLIVQGLPLPSEVPDGSPADPGRALVMGIAVEPISVRRVVVTNSFFHENPGDLLGSLSHGQKFAVLNNHRGGLPGQYTFVYEDNGEEPLQQTDGPGSLRDFMGEEGLGVWVLAMLDNSISATGRVDDLVLRLEPQNVDEDGVTRRVAPNTFTYDFVDVPLAATNLTVCVSGNTQPVELYVRREEFPTRTSYDQFVTIPTGGACLTISKADLPPLTSGRYIIGVFNSSGVVQNIRILVTLGLDPAAIVPIDFQPVGSLPLADDAVNYSSIFVTDRARIASVDVGVSLNHPRVSDLALTLISPRGTRVLLMESRGQNTGITPGSSQVITNTTTQTFSFETAAAGNYTPGFALEDWIAISNVVTVVQDPPLAHTGQNSVALRSGGIVRDFVTKPGATYTLTYAYRRVPTLDGIVSWWPGENSASDIVDGNNGVPVGNGAGFIQGLVGQAFQFTGSEEVRIEHNPNLVPPHLSIEGWIFPTMRDGEMDTILYKEPDSGSPPRIYALAIKGPVNQSGPPTIPLGNLTFVLGGVAGMPNDFGGWTDARVNVPLNQWSHVAVTYDGSSARAYFNGAVAREINGLSGSVPTIVVPLKLGARSQGILNSVPNDRFNGLLDEFSIFNRALNASQVSDIYAAGAAGKCGMVFPPASCLNFMGEIGVSGVMTNPIVVVSTNWTTNTITFQTGQSNTQVRFNSTGGNSGILVDTITLTESLIKTQFLYLTFTENTNLTITPIKFGAAPFAPTGAAPTMFVSGFEPPAPGDYLSPAAWDGWDVLTSNRVSVLGDPTLVHTGNRSLALLSGQLQRTLPTIGGRNYRVDFVYRKSPNLDGIISWWPAEFDPSDIVDGNDGALRGGANFGSAQVGQAFNFNGVNQYVEVPNSVSLNPTSSFAIDAWIYPRADGDRTIMAKWGDVGDQQNERSYIFRLRPGRRVLFGVTDFANQWNTGLHTFETAANAISLNAWNHVAAVYEQPTGTRRIYVNGVLAAERSDPPMAIHNGLARVGIGATLPSSASSREIFNGLIDELTIYSRVLSAEEIRDIYAAGSAGKCGMIAPPDLCAIPGAQIFVPNLTTNTFFGSSTNWQTNSLTFTATSAGTPLGLSPLPGGQSGVLLDTFSLSESEGALYYLPEESLNALRNENVFGEWRLEVLDTRTGATNLAALADWQLQFVYQTDVPLPGVLDHGVPKTNSVPPGQIAYYIVDVPFWARFATNTLLFASGPVDILFNQTTPPSGTNIGSGDFMLIGPGAVTGVRTLSTNGVPPLMPGLRYYLGISNGTPTTVTYALQVEFDITQLFNGVAVAGTNDLGALPRYFSFDVSTNATAVSFSLTNLTGNAELVVRRGGPPPTLASHDYGSFNPGNADENILLFTNSTPVPVSPGRWYLGVYNVDVVPVGYSIVAVEYTNAFPPIITLTNGIPYANTNNGPANAADYYRYNVSATGVRVQFEINNSSGDLTLLARKGLPLPDPGNFDYISANAGLSDELIIINQSSVPVPLTPGDWFLAAINVSGSPTDYSIKATEWTLTGQPIIIVSSGIVSNEFCLTWTSLPGAHYYVQGLTNLSTTNFWDTISPTITASDYLTSWCVPLPSPYHFFRVIEGLSTNLVTPPTQPMINSISYTNNAVLIQWNGVAGESYQVQWSPTLVPATWNSFTNVVISTGGTDFLIDDGSQTGGLGATRFYRLIQLP